jgi:hypothetical protein
MGMGGCGMESVESEGRDFGGGGCGRRAEPGRNSGLSLA